MRSEDALGLLNDTYQNWTRDNAPLLGAAVAFYSLLSVAPIAIITVLVAGSLFGNAAAQGEIARAIAGVVGPDAARLIQGMIDSIARARLGGAATVLGFLVLLVGASGLFNCLRDALNAILKVSPRPGRGIVGFIRDRLLAVGMVFVTGVVFLLSLSVGAVLAFLEGPLSRVTPSGVDLALWANLSLSFVVVASLIALTFRTLPEATIAWRDILVGALVTSGLLTAGTWLIGQYLGRSGIRSVYGAAGSMVVLLLWIYYSAQVFFLGVEFTRAWAIRFGSGILPTRHSVPLPGQIVMAGESAPVEEEAPAEAQPQSAKAGWGSVAAAGVALAAGVLLGAAGLGLARKRGGKGEEA